MIRSFLVSLILVLIFHNNSSAQTNKFVDDKWVKDSVSILNEKQKQKLSAAIQQLEDSVGSQMVILIIDTLNGESIDDYSFRIANDWGIGRAKHNDGILITVSIKDHKTRIEVGYGLEKIISDQLAAEIIRIDMIPNFKAGNFYEGIYASVMKMKSTIIYKKDHRGK